MADGDLWSLVLQWSSSHVPDYHGTWKSTQLFVFLFLVSEATSKVYSINLASFILQYSCWFCGGFCPDPREQGAPLWSPEQRIEISGSLFQWSGSCARILDNVRRIDVVILVSIKLSLVPRSITLMMDADVISIVWPFNRINVALSKQTARWKFPIQWHPTHLRKANYQMQILQTK
jgi:hypothetical protein